MYGEPTLQKLLRYCLHVAVKPVVMPFIVPCKD